MLKEYQRRFNATITRYLPVGKVQLEIEPAQLMEFPTIRQLPDLVALLLALYAQMRLAQRLVEWVQPSARMRTLIRLAAVLSMAWVFFGFAFGAGPLFRKLPATNWVEWLRGGGMAWGILTTGIFLVDLLWSAAERTIGFDPSRRRVLGYAKAAAFAAPAVVTGFGVFIERHNFRMKEVDIRIKNLPRDLDRLRLVQLTDIHFGPYLGTRDLRRAVDMANETKAHLGLVTGDLITMRHDSLDDCLRILSAIKTDAGMFGCHGNHEMVARCEDEASEKAAAIGLRILRGEKAPLRFGNARLNIAGVDYQRSQRPYLQDSRQHIEPDAFNLLLSHNPDVCPVAARQGWDLTVAGHTHGGQVTVEILHQYINVVRFFTPYVYGLYEQGERRIWVSRGLGTIGAPVRVGAPPEVALLRLCAT